MKGVGMLVVSVRGINFGCWSHLACAGQNAIIFSHEGLVQGCTRKIYIVCVLSWSLLGVKKAWAPSRSVSFRGLIQNFRRASPPLSYTESPPGKILRTFLWQGAQTWPPIIQKSVYIAFGQVSPVRSIIIQLQSTPPLNGLFYKVNTQNCLTDSDIR